jgi:hypothetical protein
MERATKRVRVHFNLRTHFWSITAMDGPNRGRVVQHSDTFALTCCKFKVSEAGRQRVLAKGQRLVHAWVEGLVAPLSQPPKDAVEFTYNPYRAGTFTRRDTGQPIASALCCWLIGQSAFASLKDDDSRLL